MSFGLDDSIPDDPLAAQRGYGRRPAAYPIYRPDVADPKAETLLQRGLSGVGYVGSSLDKLFGGRAVRGGLDALLGSGQHPSELLSAIPFSDTLGITDPENSVSGAKLIKNTTGYNPAAGNWLARNLLGPAAEVALDPSTYLGGVGALSRLGQEAKMAGKLTPGLLPSIRAGERTLIHGWSGEGAANLAQGVGDIAGSANRILRQVPHVAAAEDVLGRGATKALAWERAMLSPEHGFVPVPSIQASYKAVKRPAERAGMVDLRGTFAGLADREAKLAATPGIGQEPLRRFLRQKAEGVRDPSFYDQGFVSQLPPEAHALADEYRQLSERAQGMEQAAGYTSPGLLDSEIAHTLRQRGALGETPKADWIGRQRLMDYTQGKNRLEALKHLPGGTVQIEDLVHDPRLAGAKRTFTDEQVAEEIFRQNLGSSIDPHMKPGVDYSRLMEPHERTVATAEFLKGVDTSKLSRETGPPLPMYDASGKSLGTFETPTESVPYFNPDVLQSQAQRLKRAVGTSTSADTLFDVLRKTHVAPGEGMRDVSKVLASTGLDTKVGIRRALEAMGTDPAVIDQEVAAATTASQNKNLMQALSGDAAPTVGDPALKHLQGMLAQHAVPEEVGQGLADLLQRYTTPHELAGPQKWASDALGAFKRGAYTIWPSAHVRNLGSGRYQNLVDTGLSPVADAYGIARDVLHGKPVQSGVPSFAHLDPALQSAEVRKLAYAHGVIGEQAGELAGQPGKMAPAFGTNPLDPWPTIGDAAKQFGQDVARPGWKAPWNPEGAFVKAGKNVNTLVENELRMGEFTHLLQKGWDPAAAAEQVRNTHFDYTSAGSTPFIQNVVNPMLTFPTYSRFNIPKQIGLAVTNPARQSAPIRFSGAMNQEGEGYVPQYLQGGLALPYYKPTNPEGTQSLISKVGLPFEEAFGHLTTGTTPVSTVQKTAQNMLGFLRPDVKAALEFAMGTQAHTGRRLSDLEPGKIASGFHNLDEDSASALAQLISATPASRAVGTLNRLMDERKFSGMGALEQLIGLGTGIKTTDVDVEKWKAVDARRALEEVLSKSPHVRRREDYYIPKTERQNVTPEEADQMRLFATMKKNAREAAKQKLRVGIQQPQ